MAFCSKCGAPVGETAAFCAECGEKLNTASSESAAEKAKNVLKTKDITHTCDPADIKENIDRGILAYLGLLVLVPIFGGKRGRFARFHANQGLVLLAAEIIYSIIYLVVNTILAAIFLTSIRGLRLLWLYGFLNVIFSIPYLLLSVLTVIGIVNAARGRAKELPLIGSFRFLKMKD